MATKYLKGECSHCGGHIEFPAESAGMTADCPHCGKTTELLLVSPKIEPTIPAKTIVWTVIAVVILGLGLAGALVALKMAQKKIPQKPVRVVVTNAQPVYSEPETPEAKAGFKVSPITLEKTAGSSLVHAVGTVTNTMGKQRFGVKLTLDLLNASGVVVGTATDYQQVIEPKGEWRFKALLVDSKAVAARLNAIKEDQ